ncbi:MAG: YqaJ viral recombinase family protein [Paludibacteraceae bacterium]|nr:YqaJ viral recombinase family protein [Paludibacteraceae bacterium]MBQ6963529.1 YqaJ viral recombinase family protein [Paludibacteraceae bacterium]MBQ7662457.1 YqaJ viral recombinase family protein [Prevotella sp.]MBQ7748320.1 YqaJ viral recombinase family protein [Paludibacteraceae bacterium]
MKKILRFKDRQGWLNARTLGIGASEVSTIIGLNPFETPYQLWRRKMGIDAPKQETISMRDGHFLEGAIADYFGAVTDSQIIKNTVEDFMIVNEDKPFLRVSPDRLYWNKGAKRSDAEKCVLECKSTNKSVDIDDIPKHWFCQLQMNLGVGEYQQGALAWFCKINGTFGHTLFRFEPEFFGWLSEEVEKFWTDNIVGKKEPEAVNVNDIVAKYSVHTDGKQIEVGDDMFEVYSDLKNLKDEIAVLEERKTELEGKLKMAFGDAESISYGGATLATWKAPKATKKFNAKWFCESNPALADEFSEEVQGARRFVLK